MLLLLDCDGTLETGQPPGPVKLEQLNLLMSKGFVVVIVSESGNCANLPLPRVVAPGNRLQALVNARLRYPGHRCLTPHPPTRAGLPGVLGVTSPLVGATRLWSTMKDSGFLMTKGMLPTAFFIMFKAPFRSLCSLCPLGQ